MRAEAVYYVRPEGVSELRQGQIKFPGDWVLLEGIPQVLLNKFWDVLDALVNLARTSNLPAKITPQFFGMLNNIEEGRLIRYAQLALEKLSLNLTKAEQELLNSIVPGIDKFRIGIATKASPGNVHWKPKHRGPGPRQNMSEEAFAEMKANILRSLRESQDYQITRDDRIEFRSNGVICYANVMSAGSSGVLVSFETKEGYGQKAVKILSGFDKEKGNDYLRHAQYFRAASDITASVASSGEPKLIPDLESTQIPEQLIGKAPVSQALYVPMKFYGESSCYKSLFDRLLEINRETALGSQERIQSLLQEFYKMAQAIQALHEAGYRGVEVKPDNFLVNKDEAVYVGHTLVVPKGSSIMKYPWFASYPVRDLSAKTLKDESEDQTDLRTWGIALIQEILRGQNSEPFLVYGGRFMDQPEKTCAYLDAFLGQQQARHQIGVPAEGEVARVPVQLLKKIISWDGQVIGGSTVKDKLREALGLDGQNTPNWSADQRKALEQLSELLLDIVLLKGPDEDRNMRLRVDYSKDYDTETNDANPNIDKAVEILHEAAEAIL